MWRVVVLALVSLTPPFVADLGAQADTVEHTDPAPDRSLLATTARSLPADSSTFAVMGTIGSGVYARGITNQLMLTVGGPVWTVLYEVATFGWNLKYQILDRESLDVAVGNFGFGYHEFGSRGGTSRVVHWPYVSATLGSRAIDATVNLGFGVGESRFDRSLGRRAVVQAAMAIRIGSGALVFGEFHGVLESYGLTAVGLRVWDGRYFMDMGGIVSVTAGRWLPWITIGGRL